MIDLHATPPVSDEMPGHDNLWLGRIEVVASALKPCARSSAISGSSSRPYWPACRRSVLRIIDNILEPCAETVETLPVIGGRSGAQFSASKQQALGEPELSTTRAVRSSSTLKSTSICRANVYSTGHPRAMGEPIPRSVTPIAREKTANAKHRVARHPSSSAATGCATAPRAERLPAHSVFQAP